MVKADIKYNEIEKNIGRDKLMKGWFMYLTKNRVKFWSLRMKTNVFTDIEKVNRF